MYTLNTNTLAGNRKASKYRKKKKGPDDSCLRVGRQNEMKIPNFKRKQVEEETDMEYRISPLKYTYLDKNILCEAHNP